MKMKNVLQLWKNVLQLWIEIMRNVCDEVDEYDKLTEFVIEI